MFPMCKFYNKISETSEVKKYYDKREIITFCLLCYSYKVNRRRYETVSLTQAEINYRKDIFYVSIPI